MIPSSKKQSKAIALKLLGHESKSLFQELSVIFQELLLFLFLPHLIADEVTHLSSDNVVTCFQDFWSGNEGAWNSINVFLGRLYVQEACGGCE